MSVDREIVFTLDLDIGRRQRQQPADDVMQPEVPRIARLLALAIRLEGLVRDGTIRDYAEAARLGRVTRAHMTQIIQLLNLAPDIQEQVLFEPPSGLKERNLRPVANQINWNEQRRLYQQLVRSLVPESVG